MTGPVKSKDKTLNHTGRLFHSANSANSTKTLVICAMLTAVSVVLSRFASVSAWNIRIGFSFTASALAGMLYGPVAGGAVDGAADLIGTFLFPSGPFFPGFTLTAVLRGVLFGLFLHGPGSLSPEAAAGPSSRAAALRVFLLKLARVLPPVLIYQVLGAALLNSLWIAVLYGSDFRAVFVSRLPQVAVMIPVQAAVLMAMGPFAERLRDQAG